MGFVWNLATIFFTFINKGASEKWPDLNWKNEIDSEGFVLLGWLGC
jgi:hypothetical protein